MRIWSIHGWCLAVNELLLPAALQHVADPDLLSSCALCGFTLLCPVQLHDAAHPHQLPLSKQHVKNKCNALRIQALIG